MSSTGCRGCYWRTGSETLRLRPAARWGASEQRLAPWLASKREEIFLATKTGEREGSAARAELERSLERMGVDSVDLIQLHNLVEADEWEQAFAPNGAVASLFSAREEGLCRHIGITGHGQHSAAMHLRSLSRANFTFERRPSAGTHLRRSRVLQGHGT